MVKIADLAAIVERETGLDATEVEKTLRIYLDKAMCQLREGKTVNILGMGNLKFEVDENGRPVAYSFEASKDLEQRLNDNMRKNPSLN